MLNYLIVVESPGFKGVRGYLWKLHWPVKDTEAG